MAGNVRKRAWSFCDSTIHRDQVLAKLLFDHWVICEEWLWCCRFCDAHYCHEKVISVSRFIVVQIFYVYCAPKIILYFIVILYFGLMVRSVIGLSILLCALSLMTLLVSLTFVIIYTVSLLQQPPVAFVSSLNIANLQFLSLIMICIMG